MYIFTIWIDGQKIEERRQAFNQKQKSFLDSQVAWALDDGYMVEYVYLVIE